MAGEWLCSGETSKGKKTKAMLNIELQGDGELLYYRHQNLLRNNNQMFAIWSFDKPNQNLIVARTYHETKAGNFTDLYEGTTWTPDKLVITAREVWLPLFAENRFIYTFPGKGKMKMEWQVKKGSWKMGDHINCELQRNR